MTTKTGFLVDGGQIWMKLWDQICQCGCKIQHHYSQCIGSRKVRKNWWRQLWIACLALGYVASISAFWYLSSYAFEKRKETLASMCDERARMLQDQINVGMNHIQAMSVMISIFHHGENPSAIDQNYCEYLLVWLENLQRTFARYTERTSLERPLTSGVAYAVRVLHSGREQFEIEQGWTIKRMDEQIKTNMIQTGETA